MRRVIVVLGFNRGKAVVADRAVYVADHGSPKANKAAAAKAIKQAMPRTKRAASGS